MKEVKPQYAARFKEHPICEVPGCPWPSTQPHHHTKLRRVGEGLFLFRVICGQHHFRFHHTSPGEAKADGFLDCERDEDWAIPRRSP